MERTCLSDERIFPVSLPFISNQENVLFLRPTEEKLLKYFQVLSQDFTLSTTKLIEIFTF
jgi:hypothetical protein